MLHRLSLRVLPQLSLAVTEPDIRMRKRIVMFVVGLVAFAAYRVGKLLLPLSDPLILLVFTGVVAAVMSGTSYAVGRRLPMGSLLSAESPRRWVWLLGWTGAVYGMQLALLVLSLLQLGVNYDFLAHPDGPAMMAVIISSTAVSRDAVEIGHLRWRESQGSSFLTFPDGGSLRGLVFRDGRAVLQWALAGFTVCAAGAWLLGAFPAGGTSALLHVLLATLLGGSVALCAYLGGLQAPGSWWDRWRQSRWLELAKFWWWPGLAFAATYFLVLYGFLEFIVQGGDRSAAQFALMAGLTGGLMAVYCYYLGARRSFEDRIHSTVPSSMLRCPFITGLLGKQGGGRAAGPPDSVALPESRHPVVMERVQ